MILSVEEIEAGPWRWLARIQYEEHRSWWEKLTGKEPETFIREYVSDDWYEQWKDTETGYRPHPSIEVALEAHIDSMYIKESLKTKKTIKKHVPMEDVQRENSKSHTKEN